MGYANQLSVNAYNVVPTCLLGENGVEEMLALFSKYSDSELYFPDSVTLQKETDGGGGGYHVVLHDEQLLLGLERLITVHVGVAERDLLAVFLKHVRRVSLEEARNKMGLNNLQVVWSPTVRFGGMFTLMLM